MVKVKLDAWLQVPKIGLGSQGWVMGLARVPGSRNGVGVLELVSEVPGNRGRGN